jgi:hypothetical protein
MALTKREEIYDDQISPLMTKVIAICKEHDIPFVFSAQLNDDRVGDEDCNEDGDPIGPFYCTTAVVGEDGGLKLKKAAHALKPDPPPSFAAYAIPAGGKPIRVHGSDDGYDPMGGASGS